MHTLEEIIAGTIERGGSDIFIVPGSAVSAKVYGRIEPLSESPLKPGDTLQLLHYIYEQAAGRSMERLTAQGDDDFSFSIEHLGRFRCNAFRQRGSYALVLRVVSFELPTPESFGIPDTVMSLCHFRKGLVLVTGPAGSGKSTTLACMIDRINRSYTDHIITIEDPIEFIHPHKRSIVCQREIGGDAASYEGALRAALRQSPNVILLGELRDYETIKTALTAAETGQLVLSTLHTIGAANTIDRIIDVFPPNQQQQIRLQLSMVLRAVVSQVLIPENGGGLAAAFEVMTVTNAVQNMIREGKVYQIENVMYSSAAEGMRTIDSDILRLFAEKRISRENALLYASNRDTMQKKLTALG